MIALLMAAQLMAATPAPSEPPPLIEPRFGSINNARSCKAGAKIQAVSPRSARPPAGRYRYNLIDLPPGHLCLAG